MSHALAYIKENGMTGFNNSVNRIPANLRAVQRSAHRKELGGNVKSVGMLPRTIVTMHLAHRPPVREWEAEHQDAQKHDEVGTTARKRTCEALPRRRGY